MVNRLNSTMEVSRKSPGTGDATKNTSGTEADIG